MLKRNIFLFVSIVWSSLASSQDSASKASIIESLNDSTDVNLDFYNLNDSLTKQVHPADQFYENWDTREILYKREDNVVEFDSIPIVLQDSLEDKFYINPFNGNITSHFGYRRYRFHYGADIDLNTGDTVVAAFDGMVRIATYNKSYGRVIVIRHGNGLETVYAHLYKILQDTNVYVKAGTPIALGGNTGRSTGSHLHFEVRYLGKAIDPESIIDFENGKLYADKTFLTADNFNYLKRIQADKNAKVCYVQKGDTLSAIARKYNTSVSKLCYYNGINESAILQIGQRIMVK